MHVSPAMLRGLEGLPQDQVAMHLAARLGVRPSVAADYLMRGPQPKREPQEPMVTCRKEWSGAHEGKSSGGVQARQLIADQKRARALELSRVGLTAAAIAKMMGLSAHTVRIYLREGTKR